MRTKVIFEDDSLLVIHKPAGLATQTAKVGQADVVSELKNYLAKQNAAAGKAAGQPYLGVVHRLDQPVEGLLLFAKNKQSAAALTAQLTDRDSGTLNKQYYAVVCGKPAAATGELVDYMEKDGNGRALIVEKEVPETAKRAVLHYHCVDSRGMFNGEMISLMDIRIDTGRFHQIRAQMAHGGMCLLGDVKYGNEKSVEISRQLGVRNVALCAYSLEFTHPVTHDQKSFRIMPGERIFARFFEG